jgi:hypothetical protein
VRRHAGQRFFNLQIDPEDCPQVMQARSLEAMQANFALNAREYAKHNL